MEASWHLLESATRSRACNMLLLGNRTEKPSLHASPSFWHLAFACRYSLSEIGRPVSMTTVELRALLARVLLRPP